MPQAQTSYDVNKSYEESIKAAAANYTNAGARLNEVIAKIDAIPEGERTDDDPTYKALNAQLVELNRSYQTAGTAYTSALRERANALNEAASSTPTGDEVRRGTAAAKADEAKAQQIEAELEEFKNTAPDRKEQNTATTKVAKAKAAQAELELKFQQETDPARREAIKQQIDKGKADLKQAEQDLARGAQGVRTATTEANVAERTEDAQVSTANATAQYQTAQAEAATRGNRQAPTDEEAAEARRLEIEGKGKANAASDASVRASDASVASSQANVRKSEEDIKKGQQGSLYGRDQKREEIAKAVREGTMTAEEARQQMAAFDADTSIYEAYKDDQDREKAQRDQQLTQRGQDNAFEQSKMGNFASMANGDFSQIAGMNTYATPGSGAGADALIALGNIRAEQLGQYKAPAAVAMPANTPSFLGKYAGAPAPGPVAPVAAPAVAPVAPVSPVVAQPAAPAPAAVTPPPAAPPNPLGVAVNGAVQAGMAAAQQSPAFLQPYQPAGPEDFEMARQRRMAIVNGSKAA